MSAFGEQIFVPPLLNDLALVPQGDPCTTLVCGFSQYRTHVVKHFPSGRAIVHIALFANYFMCAVGPGSNAEAVTGIVQS